LYKFKKKRETISLLIEKKSKIDDLFSAIKKEIEGRKKEEKRKTKPFFFVSVIK